MDPREQALSAQPRLRQVIELDGHHVGAVRVQAASFVVVRPHHVSDMQQLVGKTFDFGNSRYEVVTASAILDELYQEREKRLQAESDPRKKQQLRSALAPTFVRLGARVLT